MIVSNKKKNRLIFRTVVLFVMLGAIVFALVTNLMKDQEKVKEGEIAPNFSLQELNGDKTYVLHDEFKDKGIMLNFWATYCEPCKDEMPHMDELYPKYKEKGVEIIAVSLDSSELIINNFLDDYDFSFPIVHDKRGEVMELYDVFEIPSTFFINKNGEVERIISGPLTLENLDNYLEEIVPDNENS